MAGNILQQGITPVKPNVLSQERIFVYVEEASDKIKGIASYNYNDFIVNKGNVRLNTEYLSEAPFDRASLIQLDEVDFLLLDGITKINWPYAHDGKFGLVQISRDSAGYLKFTNDDNHYLEVDIDKINTDCIKLINNKINEHNINIEAHNDIRQLLSNKVDKETDLMYKYNIINDPLEGIKLTRTSINTGDLALADGSSIVQVEDNITLITEAGKRNFNYKKSEISLSKLGNLRLSATDDNNFKGLNISSTSVNINGKEIATEEFVTNKLEDINAVQIRNIEPNLIIEAIEENLQEVATQYILDNYSRNPQVNDGLFITRTDLNNDIVKYAYFNNTWINIGVNKINLDNYATLNDLDNVEKDSRKLLILGATGTIGEKANFVVQDTESFIQYRNNLTEFIMSLIIPVTGEVDLTKEVTIDFGDTSYYLFNAVDTSKRLTLGDLDFALKESLVTGYNYLFRSVFFENSDNVGFAVLPAKEDVLSLDSDQMDNYIADGGLPNGQLAICKKVITNGYSEGGIYRFKITYPSTYEWEELSANSFKRLIGTLDNIINYSTSLKVGELYSVSGYVQNVDGFINVFTRPVIMYKPTDDIIYVYNASIYKDSNNIEFVFNTHTVLSIDVQTGYIINATINKPASIEDIENAIGNVSAILGNTEDLEV